MKFKKKIAKSLIIVLVLSIVGLTLTSCSGGDTTVSGTDGEATANTAAITDTEAATSNETTKTTTAAETTIKAETTTKVETTTKKETTTKAATTKAVETTKAHSHSYTSKITKNATCTSDGVKTFTCSCGKSYTEAIKATGHTWGEWKTIKEPTTSTEGTSQRKCSKCGATENKSIEKLTEKATQNNRYFYNDSLDGRWTLDAVSLVPVEVYFENGKVIANCYVVNGFSYNVWNAYIEEITLTDKNGTVFAHGTFSPDSQYFSIAAKSYVKHTFTFSEDAVITTNVDLSFLKWSSNSRYNY